MGNNLPSNARDAPSCIIQGFVETESCPIRIVERNNCLILSGDVPVSKGSLLNIAVHRTRSFADVDTSGLIFINDLEENTEYRDSPEILREKINFLCGCLQRAAGQTVIFTGAGVSTSANIPDFRGPNGVWTCMEERRPVPKTGGSFASAEPTYTHFALLHLLRNNHIRYLVSQNIDGLHRRSGVPANKLSEVHGNTFKETCAQCQAEYLRDYDVEMVRGGLFWDVEGDPWSVSGIRHITGRACDACGGVLRDSLIHFGENLPEGDYQRAIEETTEAKLAVCIGSSLHVSPTCDLPPLVDHGRGMVVIVNLQATGRDREALQSGGILIHAKCDEVMRMVIEQMNVPFSLQQYQDEVTARFAVSPSVSDAQKASRFFVASASSSSEMSQEEKERIRETQERVQQQLKVQSESSPPPGGIFAELNAKKQQLRNVETKVRKINGEEIVERRTMNMPFIPKSN